MHTQNMRIFVSRGPERPDVVAAATLAFQNISSKLCTKFPFRSELVAAMENDGYVLNKACGDVGSLLKSTINSFDVAGA